MTLAGIPMHDLALALCILVGAVLYSSVGHAGASAYIAMMALFGVPAPTMKPTALTLNLLVATLASARYLRAGQFRWRLLWPFLITAVPASFMGGMISLPPHVYRPLVGVVLWFSAYRMFRPQALKSNDDIHDPPIVPALGIGALLGLLAGITGTGGGIFLSPVLLLMGWSPVKTSSGVVAIFIFANSAAGLLGNFSSVQDLPPQLPLFGAAALIGGGLGTGFGIRLDAKVIARILGIVLVIAGAKMIGVY